MQIIDTTAPDVMCKCVSIYRYVHSLFSPLFYSNLAALGLQPSKLADWSSSGPESKANGHGSSSTLPRMSSLSTATAEQGREHRHGHWA